MEYTHEDITGCGEFTMALPQGCSAEITIERDGDMGPPWEEHDGHGIVSEWARRDKRAGELVLSSSGHAKRFYDYAGTLAIAKRDRWGLGDEELAKLAEKLKRKPTAREITAEAVMRDFHRLKDWCEDKWEWVYYIVSVTDRHGREIFHDSCGGFDGDTDDFRGEIADVLNQAMEQYSKEIEEAAHWAARDTVTTQ